MKRNLAVLFLFLLLSAAIPIYGQIGKYPVPPKEIVNYDSCCIFGREGVGGISSDRITDGRAIIYTKSLGFIDLGHLRYSAYLTKYLYDQIRVGKGSLKELVTVTGKDDGSTIAIEGTAKLFKAVPEADWIKVARSISYDSGYGYEYSSWNFRSCDTCHNSAFSPEDLASNYLGTFVAELTIAKSEAKGGNPFNKELPKITREVLEKLMPVSGDDALAMFDQINGCWVLYEGKHPYKNGAYLQRRNFEYLPVEWWDATNGRTSYFPDWVTDFGKADYYYTYTYTLNNQSLNNREFLPSVEKLRRSARGEYGPMYSNPGCGSYSTGGRK